MFLKNLVPKKFTFLQLSINRQDLFELNQLPGATVKCYLFQGNQHDSEVKRVIFHSLCHYKNQALV